MTSTERKGDQTRQKSQTRQTSQTGQTTFARVERAVSPKRVRELQHALRVGRGWSAARMARELECSRAHLKGVESGKKKISEMFAVRFRNLERAFLVEQHERGDAEKFFLTLECEHGMTRIRRLKLLAAPRRCPTCGAWFVPRMPRQKFDRVECRRRVR